MVRAITMSMVRAITMSMVRAITRAAVGLKVCVFCVGLYYGQG